MLYLTTAAKGKSYNTTIVSAKEVIEMLGEPTKSVFDDSVVHFKPTDIKPDRDNAGELNFTRALIPNRIDGVFDGQSFTLQYTAFAAPIVGGSPKINKTIIYQVNDPKFWRHTDSQNIEMTLMLYLFVGNQQSPLRTERNYATYTSYSPKQKANEDLQILRNRRSLIGELEKQIQNDVESVRRKAKGLEGELAIAGIETITANEFELAIMTIAESKMTAFKTAWEDVNTAERGLLRDAIDKRIIRLDQSFGQNAWVWSSSGEVIVAVPHGSDTFLTLRQFFTSNYERFYPLLDAAMGGKSVAKAKK